jgi:hypothetical protein
LNLPCSEPFLVMLEAECEGMPESESVAKCQGYNFGTDQFQGLVMGFGETEAQNFRVCTG